MAIKGVPKFTRINPASLYFPQCAARYANEAYYHLTRGRVCYMRKVVIWICRENWLVLHLLPPIRLLTIQPVLCRLPSARAEPGESQGSH